jgi:hypothetical protein
MSHLQHLELENIYQEDGLVFSELGHWCNYDVGVTDALDKNSPGIRIYGFLEELRLDISIDGDVKFLEQVCNMRTGFGIDVSKTGNLLLNWLYVY